MKRRDKEKELLTAYEKQRLKPPWISYFEAKRECWLASLSNLGLLWDLFYSLDTIIEEEFQLIRRQSDPNRVVVALLFMKSHQAIRCSAELAFSTQLGSAFDLARSAIETAVVAHKLNREPDLIEIWLRKYDGEDHEREWNKHFREYRKNNLFPEEYRFFNILDDYYQKYSEWGTHTNIASIAPQYRRNENNGDINISLTYTGAEESFLSNSIYNLVSCFSEIEKALFDAYSVRLNLVPALLRDRNNFSAEQSNVANWITSKYDN